MTNANHTHITFIMDTSSSMGGLYKSLEDAMHLMLEQQARKLAGYLTVDVNYFNGSLKRGVREADPMTVHLSLYARGGTYIYGPVDTVLQELRSSIAAKPDNERPGHVVVVIMTDGDSNGSADESRHTIDQAKSDGWDIAFLGAHPGAFTQAGGMGIPKENAIYEYPDKRGVKIMAEKLGKFVSASRSGAAAHF